jgi:protein-tyrosine kinase
MQLPAISSPHTEKAGMVLTSNESRMGDACIQSQRLTPVQVDAIVDLQNRKHIRFGEAALELGLLSEQDVRELLNVQFRNASFSSRALMARVSPKLAILHAPDSEAAEAIKRLRSELLAHMGQDRRMAFAVVSPAKREGKSYIAASLAIAFAQLNIKTLLIDANLRDPVQHTLFGLSNQTGLSTILANRSSGSLAAMTEFVPGFWILGSGPPPPNPLEILTAPWFKSFLEPLSAQVSVIVVDTPAGNQWADAQMVAGQTGSAVLVSLKDWTQLADLKKFNRDMSSAGIDVLGVVFNQKAKHALDGPSLPWQSSTSLVGRVRKWLLQLFRTGEA